jgi:hypothetical protein
MGPTPNVSWCKIDVGLCDVGNNRFQLKYFQLT